MDYDFGVLEQIRDNLSQNILLRAYPKILQVLVCIR